MLKNVPYGWLQYSCLKQGNVVLAINENHGCYRKEVFDANLLLNNTIEAEDHISVKVYAHPQKLIKAMRKVAIAVGGGTMAGSGFIITAIPIPFMIGPVIMLGGLGLLATEFEAPKNAITQVKKIFYLGETQTKKTDESDAQSLHKQDSTVKDYLVSFDDHEVDDELKAELPENGLLSSPEGYESFHDQQVDDAAEEELRISLEGNRIFHDQQTNDSRKKEVIKIDPYFSLGRVANAVNSCIEEVIDDPKEKLLQSDALPLLEKYCVEESQNFNNGQQVNDTVKRKTVEIDASSQPEKNTSLGNNAFHLGDDVTKEDTEDMDSSSLHVEDTAQGSDGVSDGQQVRDSPKKENHYVQEVDDAPIADTECINSSYSLEEGTKEGSRVHDDGQQVNDNPIREMGQIDESSLLERDIKILNHYSQQVDSNEEFRETTVLESLEKTNKVESV